MTKFGEQLFVKTTDEPITVLKQFQHITLVRRPVMSQEGIQYKFGWFFNCELESLQEQTSRTLAIIKIRNQVAEQDMQDSVEGPLSFTQGLQFKKTTN